MIKVAVVGLGKMGLSHHALVNAHPDVEVVGVCDSSGYVLGVLKKYTGVATYTDFDAMLAETELDAVVIATPSSSHARMVRAALERDLHVFCEKPFTLSAPDADGLAALARARGLVTQVGYHNRFVGTFREIKTLLDAGAIGEVTHLLGEAYGPVVLKPKGGTWRSQRTEGGGCLYDYAAHVINLVNWYLGEPIGCRRDRAAARVLPRDRRRGLRHDVLPRCKTAQISANWSDESCRKMTTRITIWGTAGRIFADRQECQVYLRDTARVPAGYEHGWNVRYTTDLTEPVWFYLRGEEYSAQIDSFVNRVQERHAGGSNDFESAAITDKVIAMMIADAAKGASTPVDGAAAAPANGESVKASAPAAAAEEPGRFVMDRLLFGDNQFFGINHMSEEKARAQTLRFHDIGAVIDVFDAAYDEGVRTFMCTTHDRISLVCDHVRAHPEQYADFTFYPGMPYAHKYANAMTENGMLGAVKRFLPDEGLLDAAIRGGTSMARKDIEGVEHAADRRRDEDVRRAAHAGHLSPEPGRRPAVGPRVQGRLPDLRRACAEPLWRGAGVHHDEHAGAADVLEELQIDNPIICSNINKIGFRMCGGPAAYEAVLRERRLRAVAMSVYASGAIPPDEAIGWVCEQPNIAVDRVRRLQQGQHPRHPGTGRQVLGLTPPPDPGRGPALACADARRNARTAYRHECYYAARSYILHDRAH